MKLRNCSRYSDEIFAGEPGEAALRHLSQCSECRAEGLLAEHVNLALAARDEPLLGNARRHKRMINTALLQASSPRKEGPGVGFRPALLLAACFFVVVPLVLAFAFAFETTKPGPTPRPLTAVSVRPAVELALAAGAARMLGPVSIVAEAESRLSWDESQRRLRLGSGAIVVDLPSGSLPGFHVMCSDFSVEVTGTRFRVDPSSVRVERGEVRVRSTASQRVLAASVRAGSVWAAVGASSSTAAVETARPNLTAVSPSGSPPHALPKPSADSGSERVSQEPLLRSIRTKIANGDVAAARRLLASLKHGSLTVDEQLEADSLRAEADLVDGKSRAAVEGYAAAAESAAAKAEVAEFAAARLSAQRGDPAQARQLLERYLERHPRGMFRREARARLRQLGAPPPAPPPP